MPGNDNNLDTLPKITEELDANVQVELKKRKRMHYQIYITHSLSRYNQPISIKPRKTIFTCKI